MKGARRVKGAGRLARTSKTPAQWKLLWRLLRMKCEKRAVTTTTEPRRIWNVLAYCARAHKRGEQQQQDRARRRFGGVAAQL